MRGANCREPGTFIGNGTRVLVGIATMSGYLESAGKQSSLFSMSFGTFAVFRWRRQSCPDDEGRFILLGHGDILVMDGQCQDEFLHRTDPGREQERINITFRWVKQHVSSCPLFKAGVACCLPTCAQGSSVPVLGNAVLGVFWAFWFLP